MEAKTITIDTRTIKEKFEDAKARVLTAVRDAADWCIENKEIAIPVLAGMGGGAVKLMSNMARKRNIKAEEEIKKLYVYDRRNGMYLRLRKPLTSAQKSEIDRRKAAGESLTQILTSMRMLG